MTAITQTTTPRKGLLIWLIVSQLLAVASLFIWFISALASFMAFDSGESPAAWAIVITVWSYPIFPIVMAIAAWIAYARHKNTLSAILSGLTFALPVLLFIALQIWSLAGFMFGSLQSHTF